MFQEDTTNYDELSSDFKGQLNRMSKTKRPTVVLRKGKLAAAVLGPSDYRIFLEACERRDVLNAIEQGRREFAAGGGRTVDEFERRIRSLVKKREATSKSLAPTPAQNSSRRKTRRA